MDSAPNVLVMAGGTGGHIYPALAVANELMTRGYSVTWLGSDGGMEQELVTRESIPMYSLPVSGLRGKGKLDLLKAPFLLLLCVIKAMRFIVTSKSQLVLGFGGFASGPGGLAAYLMRRKLIIHEQNAVAGLTNKLLSKFASLVCQAFEGVFERHPKVVTTGNPIRQSLVKLNKELKLANNRPINVLVVGGSRGAQAFNDHLPETFRLLLLENKISVWHQTGKGKLGTVKSYYDSFSESVVVSEFIHDMDKAYQWADIVICRSGALTVSEVSVIGIAAIFVPYPFAVDDHQTANAKVLADKGAAKVIQQANIEQVESLLNEFIEQPEKILEMSRAAKKLAIINASTKISDFCESLIKSS
ncbi:undecaprenyldiphospho-muramoylpentapeptide beta-N-acetylglucosaminyltransferase [Pleionea sediminis]|uniref:undecaprenyldiphospho-muramoylpentapeptide beta-N-acetylglucosaminyltransferase n=1 Tax=Pleionea sediminis TaxID=2569479 RepID=UPI00118529C6|nr:undecaprenyldiphospho-muramoylpentapeptide beta-N-acetylglucosaminyltransferase [Pleionea sediminis]